MHFFKKPTFLLTLAIGALSYSCQDSFDSVDINSASEEVRFRTFADTEDILQFGEVVFNASGSSSARVPEDEFISLHSLFMEANDLLDQAETIEEEQEIVSRYSSAIKLEGDRYVPTIRNPLFRRLVGTDRIYKSDGMFHKVIDDQYLIIAEEKDLAGLIQTNSVDRLDKDRFQLVKYQGFTEEME
mgnify:CR=1 FL=1